jgi:hypothetical protein
VRVPPHARPRRARARAPPLAHAAPRAGRRAEAEAQVPIPADIQAAIDAGNVDEVTKLVASTPAELSKAQKKKCIKNAEIAAKKLAKGGGAAPPKPAGDAPPKAAKAKPGAAPPAPTAAGLPPVPTGGGQGLAGASEGELVAALLAHIEGLGLSADAVATLRANEAELASALSPIVAAQRNAAYTAGFGARV